MKKVDYIIVGNGFAGLFFAHQLIKHRKSFVIFSDGKTSASQISAGMVNPVVLKKFTTFDNAQIQIDTLQKILSEIAEYTQKNALINEKIHRIFHDEKEKETWLKKSQNENLLPFLDTEVVEIDEVQNPFGCGRVRHSFRVDIPLFFENFIKYLEENDYLIKRQCHHSEIDLENHTYQDLQFSNMVFAEGISVMQNPFFKLPIVVNKGHHLTIKIRDFKEKRTLKKKHFLLPFNDEKYYYGGTYDRENDTENIDNTAVSQLENGLKEIITQPYDITHVQYGFRPTTKDRKPILGHHPDYKNLFIFNGLGARGLLNGAYYAEVLFQHIEHETPLPEEVRLDRF